MLTQTQIKTEGHNLSLYITYIQTYIHALKYTESEVKKERHTGWRSRQNNAYIIVFLDLLFSMMHSGSSGIKKINQEEEIMRGKTYLSEARDT